MKSILEVVRDLIKPYIDKNANNIAPVEVSPSENPYYVSNQLIYNGRLYTVTHDISIGDLIEVGVNVTPSPNVLNQLTTAGSDMTGATANANGSHGLVPQPLAGEQNKYLRGDGSWASSDATPTANSINNVQSGGVKTELDKKLPTYANGTSSWDTAPTSGSTKPVTSGGVYSAIPALSYVGMVIHSTTFNTEAKVKAYYGGTKWIQHSGYVLRGATSGVTANSATKTGGNDNAIVVKHNHTQNPHYHVPANGTNFAVYGASGANQFRFIGTEDNNGNFTGSTNSVTATNNETGEDGTNKNIPNYKSVYIWERTQ